MLHDRLTSLGLKVKGQSDRGVAGFLRKVYWDRAREELRAYSFQYLLGRIGEHFHGFGPVPTTREFHTSTAPEAGRLLIGLPAVFN